MIQQARVLNETTEAAQKFLSLFCFNGDGSTDGLLEEIVHHLKKGLPLSELEKLLLSSIPPKKHAKAQESIKELHRQFSTLVCYNQKHLQEDEKLMPMCSEKLIIQLILRLSARLTVGPMWDQLKEQLSNEQLLQSEIEEKLQEAHNFEQQGQILPAITTLEKMRKHIFPIDMHEIFRLLKKAETTKEIKDQDIVLLVGKTGSGKSTTIQSLAGGNIQEKKFEISSQLITHYAVPPFSNPVLHNITSSPLARSETRNLCPIMVKFPGGDHLWLMGASGYGDSAGPEVDIVNRALILSVLGGCKSVRILALCGRPPLGNNKEGITELAQILANMVQNVGSHLGAFHYIFTKFPSEYNTNTAIKDLIAARKKENIQDDSVDDILSDMSDKTSENSWVYTLTGPNKSDPARLLNKLDSMKNKAITNPGEILKFPISNATRAAITSFCHFSTHSINVALKNMDFPLICYRFHNLKRLDSVVKLPETRDSCKSIVLFLNKLVSNEIARFEKCVLSLDGLGDKDIKRYLNVQTILESVQELKEHPQGKVISSSVLLQRATESLAALKSSIQEKPLDHQLVFCFLNNFYMLSMSFPTISIQYAKEIESWNNVFLEKKKWVADQIDEESFEEAAREIAIITRSAKKLQRFFPENSIEKIGSDLVEKLISKIQTISQHIEQIFANLDSKENKNSLKKTLNTLNRAKESPALSALLSDYQKQSQSPISAKETHNFIIFRTNQHFGDRRNQLAGSLPQSFNFEESRLCLKQITEFQNLHQDLKDSTTAQYHALVSLLKSTLQQLTEDLQEEIDDHSMSTGSTGSRLNKIRRSLEKLKTLEWVDHYVPGLHQVTMKKISNILLTHSLSLKKHFDSFNLGLDSLSKNLDQTQEVYDVVKQARSMLPLELSVPMFSNSLQECREIEKIFKDQFNANCKRIKKDFNLPDTEQLKELEGLNREYEKLHPSRIRLQKEGFDNLNQLQEKRKELEEQKRYYLDELAKGECGLGEEKSGMQKEAQAMNWGWTDLLSFLIPQSEPSALTEEEDLKKTKNLKDLDNTLRHLKNVEDQYLKEKRHLKYGSEAQELLSKRGFKSLDLLQEQIQNNQEAILSRNQKSSFPPLSLSITERYLKYLLQCDKVLAQSDKKTIQETLLEVGYYLNDYGEFIDQQIHRSFQSLRADRSVCQPMIEWLGQLNINPKKYPTVHSYVISNRGGKDWEEIFQKHLTTLRKEIFQSTDLKGSGVTLKQLLDEAFGLLPVDSIFGFSQGFYSLCQEIRTSQNSNEMDLYQSISQAVENHDFKKAAQLWARDDLVGFSQHFQDQLSLHLENVLMSLFKETDSRTIQIKFGEPPEWGEHLALITGNLKKISLALSQKVLTDNLPEDTKQNLKSHIDPNGVFANRLQQKLISFIEKVEYIIDGNAFEAESSIETARTIRDCLQNTYRWEEVDKRCDRLDSKKNQKIKSMTDVKVFEDIEQYTRHPPKYFLGQLQKVSAKQGQYKAMYFDLCTTVRNTFCTEIANVKILSPNERNSKYFQLKTSIHLLHEDFQPEATNMLEELRQDLECRGTFRSFDNNLADYENVLHNKFDQHKKALQSASNLETATEALIFLQKLSENLPLFQTKFNLIIDDCLNVYQRNSHSTCLPTLHAIEKMDLILAVKSFEKQVTNDNLAVIHLPDKSLSLYQFVCLAKTMNLLRKSVHTKSPISALQNLLEKRLQFFSQIESVWKNGNHFVEIPTDINNANVVQMEFFQGLPFIPRQLEWIQSLDTFKLIHNPQFIYFKTFSNKDLVDFLITTSKMINRYKDYCANTPNVEIELLDNPLDKTATFYQLGESILSTELDEQKTSQLIQLLYEPMIAPQPFYVDIALLPPVSHQPILASADTKKSNYILSALYFLSRNEGFFDLLESKRNNSSFLGMLFSIFHRNDKIIDVTPQEMNEIPNRFAKSKRHAFALINTILFELAYFQNSQFLFQYSANDGLLLAKTIQLSPFWPISKHTRQNDILSAFEESGQIETTQTPPSYILRKTKSWVIVKPILMELPDNLLLNLSSAPVAFVKRFQTILHLHLNGKYYNFVLNALLLAPSSSKVSSSGYSCIVRTNALDYIQQIDNTLIDLFNQETITLSNKYTPICASYTKIHQAVNVDVHITL